MASEPFYFDQKVILTKQELRAEYERLRGQKAASWGKLQVQSIIDVCVSNRHHRPKEIGRSEALMNERKRSGQ